MDKERLITLIEAALENCETLSKLPVSSHLAIQLNLRKALELLKED